MLFKTYLKKTLVYSHLYLRQFLSSFEYFISKLSEKKSTSSKIYKILVILINQEKGNAGGDFVILGVINNFKKDFPDREVLLLADKKTLQGLGYLKNIKKIVLEEDFKNLNFKEIDAALFISPGDLRPKDFDIPYKIGFTSLGIKGSLRSLELSRLTAKAHNKINEPMIELRYKMFEILGFSFKKKEPFLNFSKEEKIPVDLYINKNKLKKFIILHPGGKYVAEAYKSGKWPPHLWNLERYSEVAEHFTKKGFKIIITGSKEESILAQEIKGSNKNVIDACGKFNLKELGGLLKKCSCLIATDTSIVHIAYQVKCPIVELLGPSIPEVVGAWPLNSPRHKFLIDKGPCHKSMRKIPYRDNFNCLKNIEAKKVIDAVNDLINSYKLEPLAHES